MFSKGKRVVTNGVEKEGQKEQIALLVKEIERSKFDPSVQENLCFICKKVIVLVYNKDPLLFTCLNDLRVHLYHRQLKYLPPSDAAFECHTKCVYFQMGIAVLFTSDVTKAIVSISPTAWMVISGLVGTGPSCPPLIHS